MFEPLMLLDVVPLNTTLPVLAVNVPLFTQPVATFIVPALVRLPLFDKLPVSESVPEFVIVPPLVRFPEILNVDPEALVNEAPEATFILEMASFAPLNVGELVELIQLMVDGTINTFVLVDGSLVATLKEDPPLNTYQLLAFVQAVFDEPSQT